MDLHRILESRFGFPAFRPNQEAVCRAATDGRDVLLVMPTGAGKSLCYQLPALAREATALVVSPLIALMDDQAAKLHAAGLRVARIHSGLPREAAREACRDYLAGTLDFLFIAPERMRVPGFPEMLARRRPGLIAIDEAHCISQWGHDFRPDYRTLGDHLPALRPAPIIALTATATPVVQQDIVAQLRLHDPALFIHGFRRSNLAIEVVEMPAPQRPAFTKKFLASPGNLPAIVYAPSRKIAESVATELGHGAAAYHAGLDPATRDRVQRGFLSGELTVVVATIAFGMGIDKADVRTVLHLALPASVEGFYQEIGRAGRDGLPSRTILLHSFADRRMHEFFLERDYPAAAELSRVAAALAPEPRPREALAARLKMPLDALDRALLKLASQGAATLEMDGSARDTGVRNWQTGYDAQLAFRRRQIDNMVGFAESSQCRMTALIRHFGDTSDSHRPCGHCDVCAPENTRASTVRVPTSAEQQHLRAILRAVGPSGRSTGKLFTDLALTPDRKLFDELLNGLARAGLLTLASDTFTKPDGESVTYRKANLTHEGRNLDPGDLPVSLRDTPEPDGHARARSRKPSSVKQPDLTEAPLTPEQEHLATALRAWRKSLAASLGKPAFLILADRTVHAIAARHPRTLTELGAVNGIGPDKRDRYGAAILALCRGEQTGSTDSLQNRPSHQMRAASADEPHHRADIAEQPPSSSMPARPAGATPSRVAPSLPEPFARLAVTREARASSAAPHEQTSLTPDQQEREARLLAWRKREADRLKLPHFLVLSASVVRHLAQTSPASTAALSAIPGIGPDKLARYAADLFACCQPPAASAPTPAAAPAAAQP